MEVRKTLTNWITSFKQLKPWKKVIAVLGALAALVFFFILLTYFLVTTGSVVDIPSTKELVQVRKPVASSLYDRNGELLGKYYIENRSEIEVEDLNDFYKNALIATEDIRFYKHNGVDTRSLFRVLLKTIFLQRDASGGGSTITQQLAKNLYPRKRYKLFGTLVNKFREMEIARRLEDIYEKDEILLFYSNTVSFGERAFGLHTAAHRFFNKRPDELLLEEAATLVGMLKATSYFSPRNHPERAQSRRNVVLGQMAKYDFITDVTYDQISQLPLNLNYQAPSSSSEEALYFKEQVRKEFKEWTLTTSKPDGSKYEIYKDGLKVYSTLDVKLHRQAEKIIQKHMARLQKTFVDSWKGGRLYGPGTKLIDEKITSHPYYKSLRENGASGKEALNDFTSIGERPYWTWSGIENRKNTRIDSIKHELALLHTGMLAVHPGTGEILVWIGGNDYNRFQYDNITGARQVGSTFKPIVYLTALSQGKEACDLYDNQLITYEEYDDWTPRNSNEEYGGQVSLKGALTHSLNTVSVQVMFETGIPEVVNTAKTLGIKNDLNAVPSLVLGTSDVSLYEMIGVYATFAERGNKKPLHSLLRIEDKNGNILYESNEDSRLLGEQVVDPEYVDLLNDMLLNVSVKGTGSRIYNNYRIPYPICVKTGT
ncbi:MAG: penicillin-binding protein, partial [Saprospiraceae bacterium]|nr:penicillin-binding protein [Saprospiraceae bacterium]